MGVGYTVEKVDGLDIDSVDYKLLELILKFSSSAGGLVNLGSLLRVATAVLCPREGSACGEKVVYSRLYRRLKKLASLGVVSLEKLDGLLWVSLTVRGLYLILGRRNSNRRKRREHYTKSLAKELLSNVNDPPYFVFKEDGTNKFASYVTKFFTDYIADVESKKVVFVKEELSGVRSFEELERVAVDDADVLILPYKTRFTDKGMLVEKLKKYEKIFEFASQKFDSAVFLTLTTDPSRFSNLYEANRAFSSSFNRFMTRLRNHFKRRGQRLHYLAVYEFTKSGLMHAHIIIFGVDYLLPVRVISEWWREAGQGRVVYVYRLRNDNGRWVWARRRPRDVRAGEGAGDYLKKYLRKALRVVDADVDTMGVGELLSLAMYWVTNKRFFTYSRSLLSSRAMRRPSGHYVFVGVFKDSDIPDWVWWLPRRVYRYPSSSSPPPTISVTS